MPFNTGDISTQTCHTMCLCLFASPCFPQTSWQSAPDLPIETRGADTVDALTGLLQLRVLDVDLYTLDRHAKHLPGLTGLSTLQTLRIQTVGGDLATSNNLRDGLLWMPHLTSLQLYTDVSGQQSLGGRQRWQNRPAVAVALFTGTPASAVHDHPMSTSQQH